MSERFYSGPAFAIRVAASSEAARPCNFRKKFADATKNHALNGMFKVALH